MTSEEDEDLIFLRKEYERCVWQCQQYGAEIAELEDLLFDDPDLQGEELVDCVKELLEYKWMYKDLCD
jgi:hypothetical protein